MRAPICHSPLATRYSPLSSGFTLLELLVVLLIIGIVSSFAVLSTGMAERDKPLGQEAQRLIALLRMAGEESVLQTQELALQLDTDGYRFLRYEQGAWQTLEDDLFRARTLPDDIAVDLQLEGRPIVLEDPMAMDDTSTGDDKDKPPAPQIVFLSSGEVSPFVLTLSERMGDAEQIIKSNGDGTFALNPEAAERAP